MKKLFFSALALFFALSAAAQEADSQTQRELEQARIGQSARAAEQGRWGVGGSFGISVGRNSFGFQVSPQFVYWLKDDVTVGGGVNYSHFNFRGSNRFKLNYFGMNGSIHYYPIRNVFIFAQPEVWRRWGEIANERTGEEVFMALPLGAGFMLPSGDGEIQISFYYDVLQNNYSPHGNGIGISIGYIFRF